MIRGARTPTEIRSLADSVQDVMLNHFAAPAKDRYQIITQHEPYEMICEDTGLGYTRTDKLLFIQVFQQGRDAKQKQELYKALMDMLSEKFGLAKGDLIVTLARNEKEDWSFGGGRAQFLDGGL